MARPLSYPPWLMVVKPSLHVLLQVEEHAKAACKGEGQENAYGPLTDEEVNVSSRSTPCPFLPLLHQHTQHTLLLSSVH